MFGYWKHIVAAIKELLSYIWKTTILAIPVSYPGDPRDNQQSRIGEWSSTNRSQTTSGGWKFATDKESHELSDAVYNKYPLTGESAGRHYWYKDDKYVESDKQQTFEFSAAINPNSADKIFRHQMIGQWKGKKPDETSIPKTAKESAEKAISFYQMLQCEDGHWAGDYGGPIFLMPGLICVLYLTKAPFPPGRREGMITYLKNHQQVDGGWGTHIECASTMFGSILSYVSLRLLGEDPALPHMQKAREFIHQHGGAVYAPSWAKFWLAVIGVYDWEGIN